MITIIFFGSKDYMSKLSKVVENQVLNSDLPTEIHSINNIAVILDALNINKGSITINEELVETLGRSGVTVKNACTLLHKSFQYFDENPTMKAAFERGRANLGSRVRSKLIEAALENNNIQSAIHLDKIYSGDSVSEVNITVGQSQLSTISDEDLLKVAFTVDGEDSETHSGTDGAQDGTKPEGGGHTPEE